MTDSVARKLQNFDAKRFAGKVARAPRPIFREALAGDKIAAKEAITLLSLELGLHAIRPEVPISPEALSYLQTCLARIADGKDANRAFNLKTKGNKIWSYDQKLMASQLVYQFVQSGDTVEVAVAKSRENLIEAVGRIVKSGQVIGSPLSGFAERVPEDEQIRRWYFKLKTDLKHIASYEQRPFPVIDDGKPVP